MQKFNHNALCTHISMLFVWKLSNLIESNKKVFVWPSVWLNFPCLFAILEFQVSNSTRRSSEASGAAAVAAARAPRTMRPRLQQAMNQISGRRCEWRTPARRVSMCAAAPVCTHTRAATHTRARGSTYHSRTTRVPCSTLPLTLYYYRSNWVFD